MKTKLWIVPTVLLSLAGAGLATTEPDNTKVNQRDRHEHELTADQQTMNKSDTEITRRIRKALVANDSLSTYAHNVKIITVNGHVTLKGPVKSTAEINTIVKEAHRVAGTHVTNELEVAKSE